MTPSELVHRYYTLISGEATAPFDESAIAALFLPDARIRASMGVPGKNAEVIAWSLTDFLALMLQYREVRANGGLAPGLWETVVSEATQSYGNIAHSWTIYAASVGSADAPPVRRGIKSFQLLRVAGEWRIAGILQHVETPAEPIPG